MKRNKILLGIGLVLAIAGGYLGWQAFGPTINAPQGRFFYIKSGSSYEEVKAGLLKEKIVTHPRFFEFMANRLGYPKAVKGGRYEIKAGTSLVGLIRMLRSGNQSPVNFVINKLRLPEDLAALAGRNFECDSASFMQYLNSKGNTGGLDSNTLMTAIIPNSYSILWNSSPEKIFTKLQNEQQKFWTTERQQKASALGLTPAKVYIVASIVEEETNKAEDKGKIASVYLNRLETGMKLGADPTVKFAMKDFGLKRILNKHLTYPSLYNTYLHAGLPPGPICTPSPKTIDAVLNAPTTDYLFFVAQPNLTGYSNFASNYEQHQKYARIYQQWIDSFLRARAAQPKQAAETGNNQNL